MQAHAQHQQLAFEGYCHLPEMLQKEWYWTEKGDQRGPYNVAELFDMAYGMLLLTHIVQHVRFFLPSMRLSRLTIPVLLSLTTLGVCWWLLVRGSIRCSPLRMNTNAMDLE